MFVGLFDDRLTGLLYNDNLGSPGRLAGRQSGRKIPRLAEAKTPSGPQLAEDHSLSANKSVTYLDLLPIKVLNRGIILFYEASGNELDGEG